MSKKMMTFNHPMFGTVRTEMDEKGESWFCAKDVCDALGYVNVWKAVADHVGKDDLTKREVIDKLERKQMANFVSESGLYALIFGSKLDSAREFKRWVTSEVLPQIRREGGYILTKPDDTADTIRSRTERLMQATIDRQQLRIAQLAPHATYAEEVLESVSCFSTTEIANELGMSVYDLNNLLCDKHVQYRQGSRYMLYIDYARCGYAKSRTQIRHLPDGSLRTYTRLVWTERGRRFIHDLLSQDEDEEFDPEFDRFG